MRLRVHIILFVVALIAVIVILLKLFQAGGPAQVGIHFLDIGQGDATLIQYGSLQVLIDGGPSGKSLLSELDSLISFPDRNIEVVLVTHPDFDHFAGLIDLFDHYHVDTVLLTGVSRDTQSYRALAGKVNDHVEHIERVEIGSRINISNIAELVVLYPFDDVSDYQGNNINGTSIVALLDVGDVELLLMGDADARVEAQLLNSQLLEDIEVLKVGHHGSKKGTSSTFLAKIMPEYAVISVGAGNIYGHPAPSVLRALDGINVLRTDQQGRISMFTDGSSLSFKCARGC